AGPLRPAFGSVRARQPRGDRLPDLEDRARLPARPGAGLCREVARELQGFPAAAEARELQPRSGDAEAHRDRRTQPAGAGVEPTRERTGAVQVRRAAADCRPPAFGEGRSGAPGLRAHGLMLTSSERSPV